MNVGQIKNFANDTRYAMGIGSNNGGSYSLQNNYWLTGTAAGGGYYRMPSSADGQVTSATEAEMKASTFATTLSGTSRGWTFASSTDAISTYLEAHSVSGYPVPRVFTNDNATVSGISKSSDPTNNFDSETNTYNYVEGQTFSATGLEVWVDWSDGTKELVDTSAMTFKVDGEVASLSDALTTGTYTISFVYEEGEYSASYDYTVVVETNSVSKISAYYNPTNTTCKEGEAADLTSTKIKIFYTNGTTAIAVWNADENAFVDTTDFSVVYPIVMHAYLDDEHTQEASINAMPLGMNGRPLTAVLTYKDGVVVSVDTSATYTVIEAANEPSKNEAGEYLVSTGEELQWIAQVVCGGIETDMTVRLTADITYGKDLYTPIGDVSNSFQGVFYGDGHTVKYTAKNQKSSRRGLFGKIKNAKIYDVTVKGTLTTTVGDYMGGLVGYCESSTIERCSNRVKVTTTGYQSYVGGIAAYVTGSGNVINECSNYANITANNSSSGCTGGIVGYEGYGSSLTISNCYNAGNITGKSSSSYYCIGGIVGAPMSNTSLTNVYNVGTVTNTNTSYASKYNGALCGYFSVDVTNGHWLSGSSAGGGVYSNSSVTGEMTETEMKSADFITTLGDSFVADEYSNNKGYPVLSWENVEGSKKISSLYIGTSKTEGTTSGDVTTVKGGTASAAPTITVTAPDEGWIVGDNDFTVSCDVPVAVIVKHADGTYTKVCVDSDDNSCTATLAATDSIYVAVKGDVNGDGVVKNSDVTRAKAIINGKYTTDADYLSLVADVDADEDGKLDAEDISVLKAYVLGKGTIA